MSNVTPIRRLRSTGPEAAPPRQKQATEVCAPELADYLAVLGDWPRMEALARQERERELYAAVREWRELFLRWPSAYRAAQLRAATFAWMQQVDRIQMANESARDGEHRPGA